VFREDSLCDSEHTYVGLVVDLGDLEGRDGPRAGTLLYAAVARAQLLWLHVEAEGRP